MFTVFFTIAVFLAATGLNFAAPLHQTTADETASLISLPMEEADRMEPRDKNWGWDTPQDVIGTYPDGSRKCRIFSPTNGNIEQPCPPVLSEKQYAKLLDIELCHRPGKCCTPDAKPIPCKVLAAMGNGWTY